MTYQIPLSPYAKILYNEWQLQPERSDYNIVFDQQLAGHVSVPRLEQALQRFIDDHMLFHSHITIINECVYWMANGAVSSVLNYAEELSTSDNIQAFISQPFDLHQGPLYRFKLSKDRTDSYRLLIVLHHIIIDGSKADDLMKELSCYYNDQSYQVKIQLPEQLIHITLTSESLAEYVQQIKERSQVFWQEQLAELEPVDFSFLKLGHQTQNLAHQLATVSFLAELEFSFDSNVLSTIKKLKLTPFLYGQVIYAILLFKYTGQSAFALNYPIAIKQGQDLTQGVCTNINIIPYKLRNTDTVIQVIAQAKNFIKLLKKGEANHSYLPLYDIVSNVDAGILNASFAQTNLKTTTLNLDNVRAKVNKGSNVDLVGDLAFEQEVKNNQIHYRIKYQPHHIDELLLNNFVNCYQRLFLEVLTELANVSKAHELKQLQNYALLTTEQYAQIIYDWNKTDKKYPKDKTVQQLFEEQVERTPNNTAIIHKNVKLTYRELNSRANQLAYYLQDQHQVQGDDLVALCLDRSPEMIIAILGILKAGGAYVPIEPSYPGERIKHILTETKVKVVLTNGIYREKLNLIAEDLCSNQLFNNENNRIKLLTVDNFDFLEHMISGSTNNIETKTISSNLAYVMYTSGTTGHPKGVMIEHRGLVNLNHDLSKRYNLENEVILQFSNYVFCASVTQILLSLLNGHKLLLVDNRLWENKDEFYNYLIVNEVTHIHATPTFLEQYNFNKISSLKRLVCGGEALTKKSFDTININNKKLINQYGPTEATIVSMVGIIQDDNINIGVSLNNIKGYVLNEYLSPMPVGAVGELYIGGVGLARGYLNRPELTAERFIANPFQSEEEKQDKSHGINGRNDRLYKTGDLVRWLPDGNLDYLGRNDFQVKIRGYRIELGEIETALASYPELRQCVVLARETRDDNTQASGHKYLVAYYVAAAAVPQDSLRQHLAALLPEYMVPSALVYLEALPLTINGKLDRRALPDPEFVNTTDYLAPRSKLEAQVCAIWASVLGLPAGQLSISANFFHSGGNSILAIRLISQLNKALNVNISIAALFQHKTIAQLSRYMSLPGQEISSIVPAQVTDVQEQRLSFAQERLWFIERYAEGSQAYNLPLLFKLKINDQKQRQALEESLHSLVERHHVLRSLIKENSNGQGYQQVIELADQPLIIQQIKVASKQELHQQLSQACHTSFDLSQDYPIRINFYQLSDQDHDKGGDEYYLSLIIHHIAFDGWSTDVLLQELQAYYQYHLSQTQGQPVLLSLSPLAIQYKDFALWQRYYLTGERLDQQLRYWCDQLADHQTLQLITDKPRPLQVDYQGERMSFELSVEVSKQLRSLAKKLGISLYSLLLAAYSVMLKAYSSQSDIVIGIVVANRHYPGVESLIGFFVNTLALRLEIKADLIVTDYLKQVGEQVIQAQLYQDLPFEKLVEALRIAPDSSRHPIFQVMFGLDDFGTTTVKDHAAKSADTELLSDILEDYQGESVYQVAKFDLNTFMNNSGEKLTGYFEYATSLYHRETIARMSQSY